MKTKTIRIARATAPALLLALTALLAPADTIDASAFSQSFGIRVQGYSGSTALTDFPVLVKLSEATGFQYAKAAAGGADLRFALADGTLLSHEIDTWDPSGVSTVWVNVPTLDATTEIKAHYGCSGTAPAVTAADVWSNGFVGVWHMGDDAAEQANSVGAATRRAPASSPTTRTAQARPSATCSATTRARMGSTARSGNASRRCSSSPPAIRTTSRTRTIRSTRANASASRSSS